MDDVTYERCPDIAHLDEPGRVVLALLPQGPLTVLTGPAAVLWLATEGEPFTRDEIVDAVLEAFEDAPPEAREQLDEVFASLLERGYVVPSSGAAVSVEGEAEPIDGPANPLSKE